MFLCVIVLQTSLKLIFEKIADKFLEPAILQAKLSLKLHFDDVWAGLYCTFAKVYGKNDVYVFGLNNYNQTGKLK